jgi:ribosomal protein S18 acetylase RimI-like enzyme
MRLELEDIPGFLRIAGAPPDRVERVRQRFLDGERVLDDTRIGRNDQGEVVGAIRVVEAGDGIFMLHPHGAGNPELVLEAVERARQLGAREFGSYAPAEYVDAFVAAGFRDLGERAEFKADVDDLPGEEGSPLSWRVAGDEGAAMLAAVAEGDPHGHDERGDPKRMLGAWLGAPKLRGEPECVQIGSLDGQDAAFVCAQVAPHDGWSRISYMGLVPAARGRGLGAWVHRHGFTMLREQGGKLYQGGTATSNRGMIALFEAHGCREVRRAHVLELRA